ncbi:hypothetical protein [Novosphingobium huizhouense]|uniref:hypothetical protein n=1 Tax=Novosphingobium huizhouense TaxID=2866625 RepID=UPI001CD89C12|nr:hypothetical protein [Novosphingobium huizhouense]
MDFLFRNRLFGAIVALLLLAGMFGVAVRAVAPDPTPAPRPTEDPHERFARWAAEDPAPPADEPDADGKKRYEVRVYENGRDVTAQVGDLPDGASAQPAGQAYGQGPGQTPPPQ